VLDHLCVREAEEIVEDRSPAGEVARLRAPVTRAEGAALPAGYGYLDSFLGRGVSARGRSTCVLFWKLERQVANVREALFLPSPEQGDDRRGEWVGER